MKVYKHPEYDDHYVVISIDEDMTNPREFDQLGTFITYNKRYSPDIYGGFEHIDEAGGYWYEEAITDDLGLADDFEEYHSIEALELELRRTEANKYFTE